MENDEIIADIEQTIKWLIKTIDRDTYNQIPFEGSWTASQVVEHVIMVASGFDQLLNGPTEITTRPIDEHVERIKTMFLDYNSKNIASPNITPAPGDYNLQDQLIKLDTIKVSIINAVNTLNLNTTCLAFDIRSFGHLTRLEAVYFLLFHTKRHVYQLQNIVKILNNYQLK